MPHPSFTVPATPKSPEGEGPDARPWLNAQPKHSAVPLSKKAIERTGFNILVADHQALVRSAVRHLLETKGGFAIVAEAADGPETLDQITRTRAEVVLLDV